MWSGVRVSVVGKGNIFISELHRKTGGVRLVAIDCMQFPPCIVICRRSPSCFEFELLSSPSHGAQHWLAWGRVVPAVVVVSSRRRHVLGFGSYGASGYSAIVCHISSPRCFESFESFRGRAVRQETEAAVLDAGRKSEIENVALRQLSHHQPSLLAIQPPTACNGQLSLPSVACVVL
jgi:hypothetical protein